MRATSTFARSLVMPAIGTTRLCERSPEATSSVLSTVERIAEMRPPAKSA
jgi:hypothetical protein